MIKTTLSREVLSKYKNSYFFETGTANGDCVQLALDLNFEKIFSIELDEILQRENIQKYKQYIEKNVVNLIIGDSLEELPNIIPLLDKPTTFWLDAHVDFGPSGVKKCPLYEEILAIKNSKIKTHTILIDDMRIIGSHWGEGISIEILKEMILGINPNYKITFENGCISDDILVAYI